MLHLALVLMLQQATAPVPAEPAKQPTPPPAAVQPAPATTQPAATPAQPAPAPAAPPPGELLQVRNVYILQMGSNFDQYLANRLTRGGFLQVVTDPAKADAILTERIGKSLETKMEELYPDPAKKAAAEALARQQREEAENNDDVRPQLHTTPLERGASAGRAKGTLFLIHRGSRNVIWSAYEQPKSTRPNDLDDTANALVSHLASSIDKQAKSAGIVTQGEKKSGWKLW